MPTAPQPKGKRRAGCPTKRSPEAIARILKIARTGLPLRFAASAGNISLETLREWRERDKEFARTLEAARLESVQRRWNLIRKAAQGTQERPGDWKALAWQLERSFPHEFSRPEVQLNVQNNVAATVINNQFVITVEKSEELERRTLALEAKAEKLFDTDDRPSKNGD